MEERPGVRSFWVLLKDAGDGVLGFVVDPEGGSGERLRRASAASFDPSFPPSRITKTLTESG